MRTGQRTAGRSGAPVPGGRRLRRRRVRPAGVGNCWVAGTPRRAPRPRSRGNRRRGLGPTRTGPRGEARGSEDWRISRPAVDHQIEAFTTATSGLPGTSVGLKISTTEGGYEVSAYRIGSYDGGTGAFVWDPASGAGACSARRARPGRDPDRGRAVAPSLTVDTAGWRPGFYVFRLRTNTGWETQVPYVVRSETAAGTVALVAPVTTWQAYNAGAATASTRVPTAIGAATPSASTGPTTGRPAPTTTAPRRSRSSSARRRPACRCPTSPTSTWRPRACCAERPRLRLDGARRVLDAGDAGRGRPGPGPRHQPRLLRRQHDVLADPARGPEHRPGAAAGRLPRQRARRPAARERPGPGHRALP